MQVNEHCETLRKKAVRYRFTKHPENINEVPDDTAGLVNSGILSFYRRQAVPAFCTEILFGNSHGLNKGIKTIELD